MLRMTLSFLRATPLYYILPFDHAVVLHKFIGIVIALFAFVHGIAHVGNGGRYREIQPIPTKGSC